LAQLTAFSVPKVATDLIESVQPYHAGYEPLATLNSLVNSDKHRLPVLTFAKVEARSVELVVRGSPVPQVVMRHPRSAAIISGANVLSMSITEITGDNIDDALQKSPSMAGAKRFTQPFVG